jgi:hypothetical protein
LGVINKVTQVGNEDESYALKQSKGDPVYLQNEVDILDAVTAIGNPLLGGMVA